MANKISIKYKGTKGDSEYYWIISDRIYEVMLPKDGANGGCIRDIHGNKEPLDKLSLEVLVSEMRDAINPLLNKNSNSEIVEYHNKIAESIGLEEYVISFVQADPEIPEKVIRGVKSTFTSWDGKFTKKQKKLMKELDLDHYKAKNGHIYLYHKKNPKVKVSMSSTPSDSRSGENIVKDIFNHILEPAYKNGFYSVTA